MRAGLESASAKTTISPMRLHPFKCVGVTSLTKPAERRVITSRRAGERSSVRSRAVIEPNQLSDEFSCGRGGDVMHPELIEIMRDQVCTIYRAVTGADLPTAEPATSEPEPSLEEITRSFAELEALARTSPALSERVPPFSFTPPLDVFLDGEDLLIEVAVPGVERSDVTVECADGTLVISGIRRGRHGSQERPYSGEIPYGPFYRALRVPLPMSSEPTVGLDRGLLRVRLMSLATNKQTQEATPSPSQPPS